MAERDLGEITAELRERGLGDEAAELEQLTAEIALLDRPVGVLRRLTDGLRAEAAHHWRLAVQELRDSREAWDLIVDRVQGRTLSDIEADTVKAQALDALRTVPAGLLTAATAMVPLPGFMLVTPWMLQRLGLLPSRWREAAVRDRLRTRSTSLRGRGEHGVADQLDEVLAELEIRHLRRRDVAARSALLTHWDFNDDGEIDAEEQALYDAELGRLARLVPEVAAGRRWYLQLHGDVFGPVRWGETGEADSEMPVFVCLDGESAWVGLAALRRAAGFGDTRS